MKFSRLSKNALGSRSWMMLRSKRFFRQLTNASRYEPLEGGQSSSLQVYGLDSR